VSTRRDRKREKKNRLLLEQEDGRSGGSGFRSDNNVTPAEWTRAARARKGGKE
jgi:hypothetical protein